MSQYAYDRSLVREVRIWPSFVYAAVFSEDQSMDRDTIYGLYSGAFINRHNYLMSFEENELSNLLVDYNLKMAGLTNDELIVVANIAGKRYVANIDVIIHNQALDTKRMKLNEELAFMDAKIDALDADRAALITLQTKVETDMIATQARMAELNSLMITEDVHYAMVEKEIAEQQLQLEQTRYKTLSLANDVLKIQIQIVEAGLDVVEIDLKIERMRLEMAQTNVDIAKTTVYDEEITAEQAKLTAEKAELQALIAKTNAISARQATINAEIAATQAETAAEISLGAARTSLLNAQNEARLARLNKELAQSTIDNEGKVMSAELAKANADVDAEVRTADGTNNTSVTYTQNESVTKRANAAISAATKLAMAEVISTLKHTIGTTAS